MMWSEFTPGSGLIGGLMIGLACALLMVGVGRIAGISGIVAGAILPKHGEWSWRWLFLIGLVLGALAAILWVPSAAAFEISTSPELAAMAGILVGFGSRLGGGCTSGHGVCGIARFSQRSLIAVPVFVSAGMFTVTAVRWFGES